MRKDRQELLYQNTTKLFQQVTPAQSPTHNFAVAAAETGRVLIAKIKCEPKAIKPCHTLKIITKET